MWSELSLPWQVCLELAWESYCEASVPIAAVITDLNGEILASGRNRRNSQLTSTQREINGGPLAHAEVNALLELDYDNVVPQLLTLYTLVEPCPLCIGAICMAGLKKIHYAARDGWAGSINLLQASPYLRWKQIEGNGPQNHEFETIVQILQVVGQLERDHPRVAEVLEVWNRFNPSGVKLGRILHQSGELEAHRDQGVSVKTVVERLYKMVAEDCG
jgi:tRNA(Arg) A34 adenosine deaminase TadA